MRFPLRSKRSLYAPLAVVALVSFSAEALAAPVEARVAQAARGYLLEQAKQAGLLEPSVEVTLLPRVAADACPQDVAVEPLDTRHFTRMRFAAVCNAAPSWRAEFIVRGAISAEVVVAAADLKAGQPIDAAQLAVERREIAATQKALSDVGRIVGKSSRRALRSGQVLDERWLVEPILVKRGAAVTIVARNVGVEVNVAAEALKAGRRGEIVEVRNQATGKVIRARVIGENSVAPADLPISQ